jgi:hypothetical protein
MPKPDKRKLTEGARTAAQRNGTKKASATRKTGASKGKRK